MSLSKAILSYTKYAKLSLILLIVVFPFAVYGSVYSFQTPESVTKNWVNLIYSHSLNFNYTALLKSSTLYDNKTVLINDNSTTLYGTPLPRTLIEGMDIGLQYTFNQTGISANLTDIIIVYEVVVVLNTSDLIKIITFTRPRITALSFVDVFNVNVTNLEEMAEMIRLETGLQTNNFTYSIHPRITLNASFHGETITQSFAPVFSINFERDLVRMNNLKNEVTEQLRYPTEIMVTWNTIPISLLRRGYVIGLFAICLLTIYTVRLILQQKKVDNIIEVMTIPQVKKQRIIQVRSLNDLIKVSKTLHKPIFHQGEAFVVTTEDVYYTFLQRQ